MKKLGLISFMAVAACSGGETENESAAASSAAADIKAYVLDCGRIEMNDLSFFALEDEYAGRTNSASDMCVLVRHPDGDLMWDAGLPMALNEMEDGLTNGPFHLSVPTTISEQFDAIGVSVDDIDYFSVSHSHFDHIGNGNMFAGATFLVDSDERAHMFREEARADAQSFANYNELENAETVEFDGDHDVFGDGSVVILAMPGHTPGHTSLLVNLANEGPVMFTGDLYHLNESRERRLMPKFNVDVEQTYASMDRFEQLAEEKNARVVVQHSLSDFEALPKVPEYLD
ncbi:N-acyl homoserine lactonase family protein [Hyphococcus flavus]|uniref:N-acyl homoserine lactonase family protein n=1 Tax=Hyphococcus flavus TaxID=1866326 RepID=A0AAF0CBP0_9PROT|nr:N-acyl homoserine lactonase family protein [Hyphococcus flavus]WDI31480.1 N-acyl homoserine lactonase family protein [Hyphococcus flavus]